MDVTTMTAAHTVLASGDGLRLQSGPGRDLIFKVTGDDTGGAFDYFIVEVAPNAGPPLHVHHAQHETIHVLKGRFKVRIGDELFRLDKGGFAFLPTRIPHTFLNLTDEPGEVIVVYTPGGGHKFYEELGPATRNGKPDPAVVAAIFERHNMSVLGPPLTAD
ncbi:MAG TPA: cupin domain-containing protein [Actinomycetota bacterium]|jgi:quercetin dioxygenase-like cupin family protein|nr:cupin domain-containing protein [Actinomycetota bacterium]